MADSPAGKSAAAGGFTSAAGFASLHTEDPAGTGAGEVAGGSYARVAMIWTHVGNEGFYTGALAEPFNVPEDTAVLFMGLWTEATGGDYLDKAVCEATFENAGTLQVPDITFTEQ